jgi:U3 small nucleolar RNA-associated protein 18
MAVLKTKAPIRKQWQPELPEETNALALVKAPPPEEPSEDDQEFAGFDDESGQEAGEEQEEENGSDWEKDWTEEALERAVFGDAVGFREGLRSFATEERGPQDVEDAQETGLALDALADSDVCSFIRLELCRVC